MRTHFVRPTGTLAALANLVLTATVAVCSAPAVAAKPDTVQITLDVRGLDYPFAHAAGNAAALAAMMKHATVVGHYYKDVTRTTFKLSSCMTGVTCFPDPHFETGPEERDYPVTVLLKAATLQPGDIWRVQLELPEQSHGAALNTATLVLPIADLWAEPTVASEIADAAIKVPAYEQYPNAQKQKTVDVDLIVPKVSGVPGSFVRYCPNILSPNSYKGSGTLSVRMSVHTSAERLFGEGGGLLRGTPEHGQCPEK